MGSGPQGEMWVCCTLAGCPAPFAPHYTSVLLSLKLLATPLLVGLVDRVYAMVMKTEPSVNAVGQW